MRMVETQTNSSSFLERRQFGLEGLDAWVSVPGRLPAFFVALDRFGFPSAALEHFSFPLPCGAPQGSLLGPPSFISFTGMPP